MQLAGRPRRTRLYKNHEEGLGGLGTQGRGLGLGFGPFFFLLGGGLGFRVEGLGFQV